MDFQSRVVRSLVELHEHEVRSFLQMAKNCRVHRSNAERAAAAAFGARRSLWAPALPHR